MESYEHEQYRARGQIKGFSGLHAAVFALQSQLCTVLLYHALGLRMYAWWSYDKLVKSRFEAMCWQKTEQI